MKAGQQKTLSFFPPFLLPLFLSLSSSSVLSLHRMYYTLGNMANAMQSVRGWPLAQKALGMSSCHPLAAGAPGQLWIWPQCHVAMSKVVLDVFICLFSGCCHNLLGISYSVKTDRKLGGALRLWGCVARSYLLLILYSWVWMQCEQPTPGCAAMLSLAAACTMMDLLSRTESPPLLHCPCYAVYQSIEKGTREDTKWNVGE